MDSDSFETFDMSTFDDFLARESLEEELEARRSDSMSNASSSFSDMYSETFSDIPVYRSLDVMPSEVMPMESQSGIDMVYEPPSLVREKPARRGLSKVEDDLFATLEEENKFTDLPCTTDVLEGLAVTSITVTMTRSAIAEAILAFLNGRNVCFEYSEMSSSWKCEMTDGIDVCKFSIQIYSQPQSGFSVEFLRQAGSPLLFSKEFRDFKHSYLNSSPDTDNIIVGTLPGAIKPPIDMSVSQSTLASLVAYSAVAPEEAAAAVCGILSPSSSDIPHLNKSDLLSGDALSPEGIMVMTLLGSMCVQFKDSAQCDGDVPVMPSKSMMSLLSLLRLLLLVRDQQQQSSTLRTVLATLIDSLVPATARVASQDKTALGARKSEIALASDLMEAV